MPNIFKHYIDSAHRLVPDNVRNNSRELARAHNLVNATLCASLSAPFYALLYYVLGDTKAALGTLVCVVFMLIPAHIMKLTQSRVVGQHLFILALFIEFLGMTIWLGGLPSAITSWLLCCPVAAMFLGGIRDALIWLVLVLFAYLCVFILGIDGWPFAVSPLAHDLNVRFFSAIGLVFVVVLFVLLFELTKNASFVKLERALHKIQELAIRDELTGAHNRRHLMNLLEDERVRSARLGNPFCIAILDIDYFKKINDGFGHAAGDTVLREFAKTVQGCLRQTDAFGRYGGEEFVVLLTGTALEDVPVIGERIRKASMAMDFSHIDKNLVVTVSIGVAEYIPTEAIAETINRADTGLYHAKASGRNRLVRVSNKGEMQA